jgi:hypothetical protein
MHKRIPRPKRRRGKSERRAYPRCGLLSTISSHGKFTELSQQKKKGRIQKGEKSNMNTAKGCFGDIVD